MTPYGYRIVDGKAVPEPGEAGKVKMLFHWYLEGFSIREAAERADLTLSKSGAGAILKNRKYLGDDYYPPIIDRATFEKAIEERERRYDVQGRFGNAGPVPPVPVRDTFRLIPEEVEPIITKEEKRWNEKFLENMRSSAKRAAYIYSRIHYSPEGDRKLRLSDKMKMYDWMEEHAEFTARW